jgi:hypothetical protein
MSVGAGCVGGWGPPPDMAYLLTVRVSPADNVKCDANHVSDDRPRTIHSHHGNGLTLRARREAAPHVECGGITSASSFSLHGSPRCVSCSTT